MREMEAQLLDKTLQYYNLVEQRPLHIAYAQAAETHTSFQAICRQGGVSPDAMQREQDAWLTLETALIRLMLQTGEIERSAGLEVDARYKTIDMPEKNDA